LKYLADNNFSDLSGEALKKAVSGYIQDKKGNSVDADAIEAQGTTPRRLTDLIGSLCDLTSGSGDKGTPIIHIQGYFDSFSED
jgi:F420-0:gamma-glutamyl ligase